MVTASPVRIDRGRVAELRSASKRSLDARTTKSGEMYERARRTISGGVASRYQVRDPWPIYLEKGRGIQGLGCRWQRDGRFPQWLRLDGAGHAIRQSSRPCSDRSPGEPILRAGRRWHRRQRGVARRFGLPHWRYVNSGSEATMDAIRIARAFTGRDTIVKIFGSYHGHHDYAMVSIRVPYENIGDPDNYASLPYGAGIPKVGIDLTIAVPFNDAGAMERRIERLFEEGRPPACVIMEAGHDESGRDSARAGISRGVREITERPWHRPDLRRGQDRLCVAPAARPRSSASCRTWSRWPRRSVVDYRRRHRRQRRGHGSRQEPQGLPGRDLQRESADDGRRAREPGEGPHARGLRRISICSTTG